MMLPVRMHRQLLHTFLTTASAAMVTLSTLLPAEANDAHARRVFPSPYPAGSVLPTLANTAGITGNTILVRYLGYKCAHCIRQLRYLNEYAPQLKAAGITVVAFSTDNAATSQRMLLHEGLDPAVFHIVADETADMARAIGAQRETADTLFDLHATVTVVGGKVAMAVYTEEPFMDVESIVGSFPQAVVTSQPHIIDRYVTEQSTRHVVAGPAQGIRRPLDLDFNHSPLHPHDLWVVTEDLYGHAMTIVHDAGMPTQAIRHKKDAAAAHFMCRTQAISMGSNGTFATAENGEPGGEHFDPLLQYMGPTLWSSDTAVFASRYQDDDQYLASHLDMLHQSPFGLGIAHDRNNKYWVLDAFTTDICSFDFQNPHEVGGTDHRDGIVHRYADVDFTTHTERGVPAHIALDQRNGWLYFIDPGAHSVRRLNTNTGTPTADLEPPFPQRENLAEFKEITGATVESVITAGLTDPVGMHIVDNRLLVGDRSTGLIHIYDIDDPTFGKVGTVTTGAQELIGINVGPDGRIWFVDRTGGTVERLELGNTHAAFGTADVVAVNAALDTLTFGYTNGAATSRNVDLVAYLKAGADDSRSIYTEIHRMSVQVDGNATAYVQVPVSIPDSLGTLTVQLREDDGTATGGVRATTMVVPNTLHKVVVEDATMETFNVYESVLMTSRTGYAHMRSDIFARVADSLAALTTIVWNGGSFGEVSVTDDAILRSLPARGVEILLIADDPLILRGDLPYQLDFNGVFGISVAGADVTSGSTDGERVFNGVIGDTITAGMSNMVATLPILAHHRGENFVPNVILRANKPASTPILLRERPVQHDVICGAVRYESPTNRTVVLGINASRFEEADRTPFLDKALVWLEAAATVDTLPGPDPDPTSVADNRTSPFSPLSIGISSNPVMDAATVTLTATTPQQVKLAVYSITGQELAILHDGMVTGPTEILWSATRLATGTYFLIARSAGNIQHLTIQHQLR